MPKISVIVPVYKVHNYLMQCLDSILNQTFDDFELIVVDEGDIDECRAIIDMYEFGAKKDKRVKSIHEKSGGYGASVNKGFDIVAGEYISIIESDDFIAPSMFEELYAYAKKLDADVVKVPYFEYWDKTNYSDEKIKDCCWIKSVQNIPSNKLFSIEEYPVLAGVHPSIWAALYKTSYLKEKNIRCIEAKGAGYVDNHFRLQTLCQTSKIAWLNKAFNYYRLSNPNASQALYNLGTFIQRWSDVHNLFEEKFRDKWDVLAPYCVAEEWTNTFYRIAKEGYTVTEKQAELLIKNLSYTSVEQIKKCRGLKTKNKKILISYKKNSGKILKHVQNKTASNIKSSPSRDLFVKILGVTILKLRLKQNLTKCYLFGFIPVCTIKRGT